MFCTGCASICKFSGVSDALCLSALVVGSGLSLFSNLRGL